MYTDSVKKMYINKLKQTPRLQEAGPQPPASNSSWRRDQGADDSLQPFSWKKAATVTLGSLEGKTQHQTKGAPTTKDFHILIYYWTMNHRTMVPGLRVILCCIWIRLSNQTNNENSYLHVYFMFPFASNKTLSVTAEKLRSLGYCCSYFPCMGVQSLLGSICFWEVGGGSPQNCPSQIYLYFSLLAFLQQTSPQLSCSRLPFGQHTLPGIWEPSANCSKPGQESVY